MYSKTKNVELIFYGKLVKGHSHPIVRPYDITIKHLAYYTAVSTRQHRSHYLDYFSLAR